MKMSNLILTLDDAVKVAMGFMHEYCEDLTEMQEIEVVLRQDMQQKCYINMPFTDAEARKAMIERIMDINPAEIASQIESDNLRDFCNSFQIWMQMMLTQIGGKN